MAGTTDPRLSAHMATIKGKHTRPEMVVRRLLHRLGYRYRLHVRGLPGTSDLVFPRRRKVILVQGCFWHQHPDPACRLSKLPRSRPEYWLPKLQRNRERDIAQLAELRLLGWEALKVWECQIKNFAGLESRLIAFLGSRQCHLKERTGSKAGTRRHSG